MRCTVSQLLSGCIPWLAHRRSTAVFPTWVDISHRVEPTSTVSSSTALRSAWYTPERRASISTPASSTSTLSTSILMVAKPTGDLERSATMTR